jgi:imidazolonepropionase
MKSILIKNIQSLAGIRDANVKMVKGTDMKTIPTLENAFLLDRRWAYKSFWQK